MRRDFAVICVARLDEPPPPSGAPSGSSAHHTNPYVVCGACAMSGLAWWRLPSGAGGGAAAAFVDVATGGKTSLRGSDGQGMVRVSTMADAGPGRLAVATSDGALRLTHLPSLATLCRVELAHGPNAPALPSFLLPLRPAESSPPRAGGRADPPRLRLLPRPSAAASASPDVQASSADMLSADVSGHVRRWRLDTPDLTPLCAGFSSVRDGMVFAPGSHLALRAPLGSSSGSSGGSSGGANAPPGGLASPKLQQQLQQHAAQQRYELWDVLNEAVVAFLEGPPQAMAAPTRLTVRVVGAAATAAERSTVITQRVPGNILR